MEPIVTAFNLNDRKIVGGFGNQLFLIAAALGSAKCHGHTAIFPSWHRATLFENPILMSDTLSPDGFTLYEDPFFHYTPIPNTPNLALKGYFQSERYFKHAEAQIRHHFAPRQSILDALRESYKDILDQRPISLHIRRGDYLKVQGYHPVLPKSYYLDAVTHFPKNQPFLIFSDDIDWCKTHFQDLKNPLYFSQNQHDYEDLFLMSLCADHILANSSFSWWGSWLNPSPSKKIVMPTPWFGKKYARLLTHDLYPSGAIKQPWQRPKPWWALW